MKNKKLLLHVGYTKTATTSLQESILVPLHKSNLINYIGRVQFSDEPQMIEDFTELYRSISSTNQIDTSICVPNDKATIETAQKLDTQYFNLESINKQRGRLKNNIFNIFSDENSTAPFRSPMGVEKTPERLKELFDDGNTDISILIVLRKQTEMIPSIYAQIYHNIYNDERYNTPEKLFLDDEGNLIKNENYIAYNYSHIISLYKEVFGAENVRVELFEDIKENKDFYIDIISDYTEIKQATIKEISSNKNHRVKGRSESGAYITHVPVIGIKEKIFQKIIKSKWSTPLKLLLKKTPIINYRLKKVTQPKKSIELTVPKTSSHLANQIFKVYKDSNLNLHFEHEVSLNKLKKYGYID